MVILQFFVESYLPGFDLAFFVTFRSSGLFNVMQKTVEAYHDNDDLCGTMLKCLIAFV